MVLEQGSQAKLTILEGGETIMVNKNGIKILADAKNNSNLIVDKYGVRPMPQALQKGPVRYSNHPHNPIVGLDKLNSIKVR